MSLIILKNSAGFFFLGNWNRASAWQEHPGKASWQTRTEENLWAGLSPRRTKASLTWIEPGLRSKGKESAEIMFATKYTGKKGPTEQKMFLFNTVSIW